MIQYKAPGVTVFESALYRTTATVIDTGGVILIVDPNFLPQEIRRIRCFIDEIRKDRELYLLFTHSDYDHILGWQAFPEAKVIASSAFANNSGKENILEQIRQFDEEYYIRRNYPIDYPVVDIEVAADGQVAELGEARLQLFLAPGHTADGIFIVVENTGAWIAGDYLSNIEFPFIYDSSYAYEQTLRNASGLIDSHEPALLIPGHGDVTLVKAEMRQRCEESLEYLYNLRQAVQSGEGFPEEKLWQRYGNKRGLMAPHQENLALVRRELENRGFA